MVSTMISTVNTMAGVMAEASETIPVGTRVDVRSRYVGEWAHGFEVIEHREDGYVVRRLSDGSVVPGVFSPEDVRAERRRQGFWWY